MDRTTANASALDRARSGLLLANLFLAVLLTISGLLLLLGRPSTNREAPFNQSGGHRGP